MNAGLPPAPSVLVPPYGLSGRVYGVLLNHRSAFAALEGSMHQAPYRAPPKAPILFIKPRNTFALHGDAVVVPGDVPELEVGASLGVVIGQVACDVPSDRAAAVVAGFVIVNDVSVPHSDFYRPAVRLKCRDGFCPLGPRVVPTSAIPDPDQVIVRTLVDGEVRSAASTAELVRPVAQLISDVTEFMTLSPGDVLAVGAAFPAPRVRAGQTVRIEVDGIGSLENVFVAPGAVQS
jgi:5-oxopent-3-ene-1,2,5-tricarboxylate decarboxylase / 2-hydroxyhepta-2,4-diene-1,7-dioate isomerase